MFTGVVFVQPVSKLKKKRIKIFFSIEWFGSISIKQIYLRHIWPLQNKQKTVEFTFLDILRYFIIDFSHFSLLAIFLGQKCGLMTPVLWLIKL